MYRILLADDEEIFLDYMCQAIDWESFGCQICARCEDGVSAWRAMQEKQPDIVFLDISMPRMDGLEVCERIHDEKTETMVVIMSAHDEFSFACKAIKLDVTDYLLKPFTETELETSLRRVLGKLTQRRPALPLEQERMREAAEASVGRNDRLVNQIESYIAEHYHERDLSIDRIAMALQFENSYLRRVYKRSTGVTIAQRIDEIRIQRAKALLQEGRLLNREIAEAVGYSDQYYFSRRFKEISGETPTEYRSAGDTRNGIG